MVPFSFAGDEMRLVHGRALFWPREQALLVADLHLEKASFFAAHGQMLPPYDSRETLERLALAVRETGAKRVYALGDNFHDAKGCLRLEPHAAGMLAALTRALDWVWITGNHDAGATEMAGGQLTDEIATGGSIVELLDKLGEQDCTSAAIACTHGLFAGTALQKLREHPSVTEVVTTDTVPQQQHDWPEFTVRSVAPLFAEAIKRIHDGESISSMFDGVDPAHGPPQPQLPFAT